MELISVIVPAYNVKGYLRRCIDSIVNQTYRKLEIILVDDGSTDGTEKLCDKLAQEDVRITVVHKENGGQADARNVGLDRAKGAYISFIDADDYIEPDMYERTVSEMEDARVSMVAVGIVLRGADGTSDEMVVDKRRYLSREEALKDIAEFGKLLHPSSSNKLFRRYLFEHVRYRKGIINEDTEIIPRIIDLCDRILVLDTAMYHYVLRENSTMMSDFGMKNYHSLIAYKSLVLVCRERYPQVLPYADYYEVSELYEALVRLSLSANYKKMKRQAVCVRIRIAGALLRCLKWKEIRRRNDRELLIYTVAVLAGYKVTYRLMMLKQKVTENESKRDETECD